MYLRTHELRIAKLMLDCARERLDDAIIFGFDTVMVPEYSGQEAYWECCCSLLEARYHS